MMRVGWGTYGDNGMLMREGKQHLTENGMITLCGVRIPFKTGHGDNTYGASDDGCSKCERIADNRRGT